MVAEFLPLNVVAWTGVCVHDAAFIDVMNGFDGVCYFLFSVVVDTDVFGDAVEPAVKRSVCAEGVDGTKRFYPSLLRQILCGFDIFDASQNVRIEAGLVCGDKWSKRFCVAVLGLFNEVSFVGVYRQDSSRVTDGCHGNRRVASHIRIGCQQQNRFSLLAIPKKLWCLRTLGVENPTLSEVLKREVGYFQKHSKRIQYQTFIEKQYHTGSGLIGSAYKHVVQRCK